MCRVCVVLLRVQDKNDEWFTTNHFFYFEFFHTNMLQKTKKIDSSFSLSQRKSLKLVLLKTKQEEEDEEEEGILPHIIYQ